jgi:hypothetical protein
VDATSSRRRLPVAVLTACGLVIVSGFLPWATVYPRLLFQGLRFSFTGWSSAGTLFNSGLPAWIIPAASLFVAGQALMNLLPNTRVPRWLPLHFAGLGLVLLLAYGVWVVVPDPTSAGRLEAGWYLALVAYVMMVVALVRDDRAEPEMPEPTASASQRASV